MNRVYRIYPEDPGRRAVTRLASDELQNFTLQEAVGYYRGQPERSIALSIVDAAELGVPFLAQKPSSLQDRNPYGL